MMIEIKKISETDAADIEDIEKKCFSRPWSQQTLECEISNRLCDFFGAYNEENKLLGYIGSQTVEGECSIYNVAVLPDARRNGIGNQLVKKLISLCRARNDSVIFLEVRSSNLPAINLYEKNGFVFCGLRKDYYDDPKENAILMQLTLNGIQEMEDPIEIWDEE